MDISINSKSSTSVYQQIVQQIRERVIEGHLPSGASLPPIRQLATNLDINPNTVAKAYQILEQEGVTKTAGRRGTFIQSTAQLASIESIERKVINQLAEVISYGQQQRLSNDDLLDLFNISLTQSKKKL